jgi:hypothetical protein
MSSAAKESIQKRNLLVTRLVLIALLSVPLLISTSVAFGQDYLVAPAAGAVSIFPAPHSMADAARMQVLSHKTWELSLIPLFAAQGLDSGSSWGLRETNPLLSGSNGAFGMKAASIKIGFVAGAAVAEYLLLKRHPEWAKLFVRLNSSDAILTTGFAVHNFVVAH